MKKNLIVLIALWLLTTVTAKADEGMWIVSLINKNYSEMKAKGLKLKPDDIYNINKASLKDAVVIFGRGCTGEIVSDEGLLLTNHHCGYGQIQEHSTLAHDYLKDGFWAMHRKDELPNPGLSATFLVRVEDVSEQINKELKEDMKGEKRQEKIDKISMEIIEKATNGTHYTAKVKSFFGQNDFYLLVYEVFKDVRLVGAPPSSIGKFGADTDNWMWPRHTCDFSVFRVYMSPDGKPATYSENNIPYKPKHFFPISVKGLKKDDFTMIMGYPGSTERYMTSYEVNNVLKNTNPNRVKIRGIKQGIMMKDMQADPKVRIQYATKYAHSSNYWKYSIGQNKGLKKLNVYHKKQNQEKEFTKWVQQNKDRIEIYGEALNLIEKAIKENEKYENAKQYISECFLRGSEIFLFAGRLQRHIRDKETAKKYALKFFKDYNVPTDKKITKAMIELYAKDINKEFYPEFYSEIEKKYSNNIAKYTAEIFAKTILTDKDKVLEIIEKGETKKIENDIAFKIYQTIIDKYNKFGSKIKEEYHNLKRGQRLYMKGLREMNKNKKYYPDANFTMRLTYGVVGDYSPADAVQYKHYTTLKGVMEKEDPNNWEFVVPAKLKELYNKKDYGQYGENGKLITCFTSNNDITGGNSGSPVINGKGELVGIAFDGNWEAMSGDIAFETDLQKTISVDIRYVLFIIDKFAGASHLISEMKIRK